MKENLLERVKAANDVERMVKEMRQRLREDTPRNDTLVELEERVSLMLLSFSIFYFFVFDDR